MSATRPMMPLWKKCWGCGSNHKPSDHGRPAGKNLRDNPTESAYKESEAPSKTETPPPMKGEA